MNEKDRVKKRVRERERDLSSESRINRNNLVTKKM